VLKEEVTWKMAYWWVHQNETWREESNGGYLWTPLKITNGKTQHHWESLARVQPGDVVFSSVGGKIVAFSIALDQAVLNPVQCSSFHQDLNNFRLP
jgi:hypothetical protein